MIVFKYSFTWLIALVALVPGCQHPGLTKQSSAMGLPQLGDYGHNPNTLRRFHVPPQTPEESNHFIDMWQGGSLRKYIRAHGLKNHHALFVLSHGSGIFTETGLRSAYSPNPFNWPRPKPPYFSALDLARVLGPAECAKIHNLVISPLFSVGSSRKDLKPKLQRSDSYVESARHRKILPVRPGSVGVSPAVFGAQRARRPQ